MKLIYPALLVSALALALPAGAQTDAKAADFAQLKIIQTEPAVFPWTLRNSVVMAGTASVAIDIDENGRLTECLVTAYSRKEFAESAVAALKSWKYEPTRLNGKPWATVQEMQFDYSRTGVVVSQAGFEMLTSRFEDMTKSQFVYRTHALRELDHTPAPVHVVSPELDPALSRAQAKHSVTVEFYIDEEGNVRLPSVARDDAGTAYAASALAAVRQWRFESPVIKGRPVLVLAQQLFNFVPKKD